MSWRVTGSPLRLSPKQWTSNLSSSVLACRFPPITLPGSSRLEAANLTASRPFYPLCMPRVALKFSFLKSQIASLWQACPLDKYRVRGGFHITHCQCSCSVTGACDHLKTPSDPASSGATKHQKFAIGVLGLLEPAEDFNTVRISTTNQIRPVVGTDLSGVSLKAPPIFATSNFVIIC